MTEQNKTTNTSTTESNEERKIVLEDGEIMRLSIFKVGEDDEKVHFRKCFSSCGPIAPMIQTIAEIANEEFDLICLPKNGFGGVISIVSGNVGDLKDILAAMNADDGNGEGGNTDAKGETAH